jgi:hypothetical protein
MDSITTEIFCRQVAAWAEAAIEQGRYPFRKVETFPTLLTAIGETQPPLVFWINRDSLMAGGVLLLPRKEAEEAIEMGRHCASALGLRHFVTWAAREIVFWEDQGTVVTRHKTLPLKATGSNATDDFRDALTSLMEELKVLCVVGAVAPRQLSPHCLANLCRSSLDSALPHIEEGYRLARSERILESRVQAGDLAFAKGVLTLARLLALIFHDRLPNAIQPEGLERAMKFALDTLPTALCRALQTADEEVALPPESAVRFHHLLRRLTQLQCGKDWQRAARIVEILATHASGRLGGTSLPFPPEPTTGLTLLLNPDRPSRESEQIIEVASPALLALFALQRELQSSPPARLQTTDPFNLSLATPLSAIRGSLSDQSLPDETGRRLLAARLRTSWPTRRFALPRHTPVWAWTFVHLLGLVEEGAELAIRIPADWLSAVYGERLQRLLAEECVLNFLARDAGGGLRLLLTRGKDPEATSTLAGPDGPRQVSWQRLGSGHRSFYRLALELPSDIFNMLEQEILRVPEEPSWPGKTERAIFLFTRSRLGSLLWALVSNDQPLPPVQSLRADILRCGLPIPEGGILNELQRLPEEETEKLTLAVFETELLRLLGADITLPERSTRKNRSRSAAAETGKGQISEGLVESITTSVFIDGLPRFPEQYLYDQYRPALNEFQFTGPLQVCDDFFGRVRLVDQQGKSFEVDGNESARVLLLASYGNRCAVALPAEQQLAAAILARYLSDLRALHRELIRQCHLQIAEPRSADALAERIWQSLPLPPWRLVEH